MIPRLEWWPPEHWFTKYLASQEVLYYLIRPHPIDQLWFVVRWTALAAGVGVGISLAGAPSIGVAATAATFAAILGASLLRSMISTVMVTGRRIIVVKGIVRRVAKHVALAAVAELWIDDHRYGRRLGVGDIVVRLHGRRRPGFRVSCVRVPDRAYQRIRDICFGEPGGRRKWSDDD
jgi:hypothetical protein